MSAGFKEVHPGGLADSIHWNKRAGDPNASAGPDRVTTHVFTKSREIHPKRSSRQDSIMLSVIIIF